MEQRWRLLIASVGDGKLQPDGEGHGVAQISWVGIAASSHCIGPLRAEGFGLKPQGRAHVKSLLHCFAECGFAGGLQSRGTSCSVKGQLQKSSPVSLTPWSLGIGSCFLCCSAEKCQPDEVWEQPAATVHTWGAERVQMGGLAPEQQPSTREPQRWPSPRWVIQGVPHGLQSTDRAGVSLNVSSRDTKQKHGIPFASVLCQEYHPYAGDSQITL